MTLELSRRGGQGERDSEGCWLLEVNDNEFWISNSSQRCMSRKLNDIFALLETNKITLSHVVIMMEALDIIPSISCGRER